MRPNSWHATLPAIKVREKIKNLTQELQAFQEELCAELAMPDGTPRKNFLCTDPSSAGDLGLLRDTVDQFRRVLWFYVDQAAAATDISERKPPKSEWHEKRTAGRALTPQARVGDGVAHPLSFIDRLDLVIEGYVKTGQLPYRKPPDSQ
ncbi:MAG TPA: hypothetical protein VF532_02920 [Candidatus Angelobacter sp.]